MQLRQTPMLLVAAALATSAQAEPEATPVVAPVAPPVVASSTAVAFEVNVCLASKPEGEVDPECRSMQSQLPVRFGTLKVQKRHNVTVTFGEPGGIELPTGSTVEFRPISIVDNQLHVQLEMPGVMNTRLRLQSGRSVILAGQRHSDGYLVIEVKPTFKPPPPNPSMIIRRPTPTPDVEKVGSRTTR
jgi:hypothetical protein